MKSKAEQRKSRGRSKQVGRRDGVEHGEGGNKASEQG